MVVVVSGRVCLLLAIVCIFTTPHALKPTSSSSRKTQLALDHDTNLRHIFHLYIISYAMSRQCLITATWQ